MGSLHKEIIVLGGGVIGATTAFHLAKGGAKDVLLLERSALASGTTGKSGGVLRTLLPSDEESALASESLRMVAGLRPSGVKERLFFHRGLVELVGETESQQVSDGIARQRNLGRSTELLDLSNCRNRLLAGMDLKDVRGCVFEPHSGFANPRGVALNYAMRARELGVDVRTGCHVASVQELRTGVLGVHTSAGRFTSRILVMTAGAGSQELLSHLGVEIPVSIRRAQVVVFQTPDGAPYHGPVVIDSRQQIWYREEGDASILVGAEMSVPHTGDPHMFLECIDQWYVELCRARVIARWPALDGLVMRGGWSGLVSMTPDRTIIVDRAKHIAGLYFVAGDSGRSFKIAPALGKELSDWVATGGDAPDLLRVFGMHRFMVPHDTDATGIGNSVRLGRDAREARRRWSAEIREGNEN